MTRVGSQGHSKKKYYVNIQNMHYLLRNCLYFSPYFKCQHGET